MCTAMRLIWKDFDSNTLEHFDRDAHFYETFETDDIVSLR
jgi:hypothetical protein